MQNFRALGAPPPNPQSLRRLEAPPPLCDAFELHKISQHVSKVRYLHFSTISLSPGYVPISNNFRSSILQYLCPTKSSSFENFWWCHCMWFVIPQSKILASPMNWKLPEKLFWRPFFFGKHLRLCLWSLAFVSRRSVLGKAALGLGFFLCPWLRA